MIVCMARPFSVRPSQRQIDQAKESETTATEKSEKTQRGRNPEKKTSLVKNQKTQFGENPEKCDSVVRSEKIQRGKIIERAASVGRNEKTQRVKITERDPSLVRRERLQKGNNFERDASLVRENKKDKDITPLIEDKIKILNQSAEKKQKSPGRLKEIDLDRIRLNSKSSVEYLVSKFNKNDKSDKNISCERVKSPTCSDKEYLLSKEDKKYCKSADDQCGGENELLGLPEEQQNDLSELPLEEQISDLAGLPLEKQINNFSRFPLEVQINDLSGLPLEDRIKSIVFNEESSFSDKTDNVFKFEKNEDLSPDLMPTTCQGHQQPKTSHRGNLLQSQVPTSHHKFNSGNSANITDSEKIYHRLNGVAKVSKPKIVSPRTRRLSGSRSRGSVKSPDTYRKNGIVISKVPTSSIDNYIESVKNDQVDMKIKTNLTGSCEPELVVRQCRVGSSVVFGLIQVQKEPNGNGYPEGHGLVTIRMKPDDQGRFGFNVKGGADQGMPIIVSRVAPNTPADLAIPRLNEGDQVLFINGRDVSQHSHEQVVMFIRASRETHSGELVLIVRPNVYVGEEQVEEPDFVYIPESHQITSSATGANALDASLMLLQESLESGAALAQFDQLYRKKPGMTTNAARVEANVPKNRYRDISPYDQTRVILKDRSGSDYINANYVNMEIPGSGIVNRYIAAQGPLPNTCTDYWLMVWEQRTSLIVMLTTKVERGRVKCHQYWPDLYETMDYGVLQITCVKEEETTSFAFREFNLTHVETSEERHISHMQYIAWPDHGVPDDPADFLDFVLKVRQKRVGMVEPTVVHCSAGIGRTGVLITMETAMCLIEANQPVYPLSIVRQMRDQRAMLIQTASQYKFVCEAILKVYNEGLVKPLEDYQR